MYISRSISTHNNISLYMYIYVCTECCVRDKERVPRELRRSKKVAIHLYVQHNHIYVYIQITISFAIYIRTERGVRHKEGVSGQLGRRQKVARDIVLDSVNGRTPIEALHLKLSLSLSIYIFIYI